MDGFARVRTFGGSRKARFAGSAGCGSAGETASWFPGSTTIVRRSGSSGEATADLGVLLDHVA